MLFEDFYVDYSKKLIFNDNGNIIDVGCGDFHSLILNKKGEVYFFGSLEYHLEFKDKIQNSSISSPMLIMRNVNKIIGTKNNTILFTNESIFNYGGIKFDIIVKWHKNITQCAFNESNLFFLFECLLDVKPLFLKNLFDITFQFK